MADFQSQIATLFRRQGDGAASHISANASGSLDFHEAGLNPPVAANREIRRPPSRAKLLRPSFRWGI
jgi:hypothetical protein